MSRHSEEYVRIPGVHYRCKLRFGTTQGLDHLADFFLNQVLPSEQRLSVLFNSFGLPQRIIEDILAELLKRNCATLDVLHGQIKPVADGIPGKIYDPENDRSLEIWQDDIAGGFLPFDQIENRSGAADSSRITFLRRDADTPFLPLLNASDSRIVTALGAVDPSSVKPPEGLEFASLIDKRRVSAVDIYLPVRSSRFDGPDGQEVIEFVDDAALPWWLTRAWTVALRRMQGRAQVRETVLALAQSKSTPELASRFDRATVNSKAGRWFNRFQEFVTQLEPVTDGELRDNENRQRISLLQDVENSLGSSLEVLGSAADSTHLAEMWRQTETCLVVVGSLDRQIIANILKIVRDEPRDAELIIVDGSGGADATLRDNAALKHVRFVTTSRRVAPEFCLRDGAEARFGAIGTLLSSAPIIHCRGEQLLRLLVDGMIPELLESADELEEIGRNLTVESERQAGSQETTDSSSAESSKIMVAFRELKTRLDQACDNYDRKRPILAIEQEDEGDAIVDERDQPRQVNDRNLLHFDSGLLGLAKELRLLVSEVFATRPYLNVVFEETTLDWVMDALKTATNLRKQYLIEFFVNQSVDMLLDRTIVDLFRRAIAIRSRLRFVVSPRSAGSKPAADVLSSLESLRKQLGGNGVEIVSCQSPVPEGISLDVENTNVFVLTTFDQAAKNTFMLRVDSAEWMHAIHKIVDGSA